jgi:transposase-like protein
MGGFKLVHDMNLDFSHLLRLQQQPHAVRLIMTCPTCKTEAQRFGTNRNGSQRFRCVECKKTFSAKPEDRVAGSTIPLAQVEKVLQLLIEGCSVRSAERISGLHATQS